MYSRIFKAVVLLLLFGIKALSQDFTIEKIEPPNWWVGMKWDTVQLMVYGKNLDGVNVESSDNKLKINHIQQTEANSYLFVDVVIPSNFQAGNYNLVFTKGNDNKVISFPILKRETAAEEHSGFKSEDVIYLIFADRFCDGNVSNNTIGDSLDHFSSADIDGRKGGDIEGIISRLDYLKHLGVTAIWITPMLENNMWMSYHGYAATDLYKIDPRFGSNALYKNLIDEAHKRGLKIILDHVSNHIGINHYWVKNLPMSDWFNGTKENFIKASHDKMAYLDIHGDTSIVKMNQQGWFTDYMPDLNQRNQFLKNYLIQNTLWWIEFAGIDGIREDTYPYNDQKYLSDWAEAILSEYPNFNIVGEIWQGVPAVISGYQSESPVRKLDFDSHLPSVTDFALSDAIRDYLSGSKSIYKVYETIVQDIVYADSDNLLVFFDNHDVDRAMLVANGNIEKYKIALNLVLFTRGIPQIFYGTEIGVMGGKKHGELRQPFPGGFSEDGRNAFSEEGRTKIENDLFNYLKESLSLRNEYKSLAKGKLRHIYPYDDVYILIKSYEDETTMVLINSREEELSLESSEIKKYLPEADELLNLKTKEEIKLDAVQNIKINKMTAEIFFIRK